MAIKVKVNKESIVRSQQGFEDLIDRVLSGKTMLNEIGDNIVNDITVQTRLGKSTVTGKPFKALKDSTIAQRKNIAKHNTVHPSFSPARSNLTITGQLIDSMRRKVSKGLIEVFFEGTHKPYNTAGKKKKSGKQKPVTNEELAGYMAEKGRPFVGVRPKLKERIARIVVQYLRRAGKVAGFI
jgi:hypothetical protein